MAASLSSLPFSVAWTSGLFDVARSEQPREGFATIFRYLMSLLAWVGLGLSLLAPEGIRLVGGSSYAAAARFVPLVATAFVLSGASAFLSMGPALAKSSREIVIAAAGALVTGLLVSSLLIPAWGLWGAAVAALASAVVQAAFMLRGAQRCYPIAYPWVAMSRLALAYAATGAVGLACVAPGIASLLLRLALVLSFPAQLYLAAFFHRDELESLRRLPAVLLARGARAA